MNLTSTAPRDIQPPKSVLLEGWLMIRNTIYNWIFDNMLCRRGRGVGVKITMGEGNVSNRVGGGGEGWVGGGDVEGGMLLMWGGGLGLPHICHFSSQHIILCKKCKQSRQFATQQHILRFGIVGIWDDIFGIGYLGWCSNCYLGCCIWSRRRLWSFRQR